MGGPSRIDQTPVRINTKITEDRQTPRTDFGSRVKDGVSTAAGAVAQGAAVAAPLVPGGAIISAAVSGVDTLSSSSSSGQRVGGTRAMSGAYGVGGAGGMPADSGTATPVVNGGGSSEFTNAKSLIEFQTRSNMEFLALQNQMQQENQRFSTLSNVIKVRHDTAKNSIGNIR